MERYKTPVNKQSPDKDNFFSNEQKQQNVSDQGEQDRQKPQLLVIGFEEENKKPLGKMPDFGKKVVNKPWEKKESRRKLDQDKSMTRKPDR